MRRNTGRFSALLNLGYNPNDPTQGPQYSTLLLSDPYSGAGGNGTFGYPGQFIDMNGFEWVTYQTTTLIPATNFYFQFLAWTGTYNSYSAAYAASASGTPGIYVGQSTVFINPMAIGIGFPPELDHMPAVILAKAVPEPSSLALAAAGLLGLLAYAWRKRR